MKSAAVSAPWLLRWASLGTNCTSLLSTSSLRSTQSAAPSLIASLRVSSLESNAASPALYTQFLSVYCSMCFVAAQAGLVGCKVNFLVEHLIAAQHAICSAQPDGLLARLLSGVKGSLACK